MLTITTCSTTTSTTGGARARAPKIWTGTTRSAWTATRWNGCWNPCPALKVLLRRRKWEEGDITITTRIITGRAVEVTLVIVVLFLILFYKPFDNIALFFARYMNNNGRHSESEALHPHPRSAMAQNSRFSGSRYEMGSMRNPLGPQFFSLRSSHEIGRGYPGRGLYLELERGACGELSPPSDNVLFDNQCYATTPSSSNGNSDPEQTSHYHGQRGRHVHHQVREDWNEDIINKWIKTWKNSGLQ